MTDRTAPVDASVTEGQLADGDDLPVLAEVRTLDPERPATQLPAVQAAAVAATGFVAGAATVAVVSRRRAGKPRRRRKNKRSEALEVITSKSFLVDVHLLNR